MTEENGPVETPTTAPGTTEAPATVQPGANETWVSGLQDEDNRAFVEKKQYKSLDDALKSQRELEKLLGKSIRVPGEDATPEDIAAFRQKLGVPEKPDGYELKLNTELVPEDFPYDEASAGEFRNWAHEAGLPPKSAQLLHDKFVAHQAAQLKAAKDAAVQQEMAAHRDIVTEWGEPTSESYKANLTLTGRAIQGLGLNEAFVRGGLVGADGAVKDAAIAKAMLKVGKELFQEGSATGPGDPSASKPKDAAEILYGS